VRYPLPKRKEVKKRMRILKAGALVLKAGAL